jgi:PAS domain S-box-containing protein
LYLSEEWYRVYGFDPEAGMPSYEERLERMHPEDRSLGQATIDRAIREKSDYELEFRILLPSGAVRYIHTVGHPVLNASGDLVEFVGSSIDVTERKRAEALRDGESHILEMIARDARLEEILDSLVRVVEAQFAGLLCSVLLLDEDGQHVRHGAAPSLPESYIKAIDGLCIGPKAGSCGTAMYRREPARLPCITANHAVLARRRPAPWRWLPTWPGSPLNAGWRVQSANDCVRRRRISRTSTG